VVKIRENLRVGLVDFLPLVLERNQAVPGSCNSRSDFGECHQHTAPKRVQGVSSHHFLPGGIYDQLALVEDLDNSGLVVGIRLCHIIFCSILHIESFPSISCANPS